MNANAQLAALATLKALAVEHGEVFLVSCLSAVLMSRVVMPQARPAGALGGRLHMTPERAKRIIRAIDENLPKEG
jgi:hypothetical protein